MCVPQLRPVRGASSLFSASLSDMCRPVVGLQKESVGGLSLREAKCDSLKPEIALIEKLHDCNGLVFFLASPLSLTGTKLGLG